MTNAQIAKFVTQYWRRVVSLFVFVYYLLCSSLVQAEPAIKNKAAAPIDYYAAAQADAAAMGASAKNSSLYYSELGRPSSVVRLKDIARLQTVRSNQLVGYGLVVGLNGSGDSLRNSPFTEQSMRAMLENLGINPPPGSMRANNVAAVIVTADLPPFAISGSRLDVTVSSLGDSKSLQGGSLIMTPLLGADGNSYAVAQGNVIVSGFSASGAAAKVTQGVPTSGRIPNGATIERAIPGSFNEMPQLILGLQDGDFTTVARVCDLINVFSMARYKKKVARTRDAKTVILTRPQEIGAARFIAELENLPIPVDEVARVVVDERSGTVVIGEKVRVSRVAISHGSLTVKVTEEPSVLQPQPFGDGDTAIVPHTKLDVKEAASQIGIFSGTSLDKLVKGLNQIGVKPSDIIAILQAIKTAGALHAELIVQ